MNNQKCISCDTNKHTDKCICNNERRCRTCKDCRWFIDKDYNGYCVNKNSRPYRPDRPDRPDNPYRPGRPDRPDGLFNSTPYLPDDPDKCNYCKGNKY